jgi:hypothetical protein
MAKRQGGMMTIVFRTSFDIERILDRPLNGCQNLETALEEWAWQRAPPEIDGEYEAEFSFDGQHVEVALTGA